MTLLQEQFKAGVKKMKYELRYSPAYSLLDVSLDSNEIIVAEAGAIY